MDHPAPVAASNPIPRQSPAGFAALAIALACCLAAASCSRRAVLHPILSAKMIHPVAPTATILWPSDKATELAGPPAPAKPQGKLEVAAIDVPRKGDWPAANNRGRGFVYGPVTGIVTWYGDEWDGNETASGERFDPKAMTAAHRTLPFNTVLKVTNLKNGKCVVVRINDRGPWIKGRELDLSKGAARKIGFIEDGLLKCKIEVLEYPLVETGGPGGNG